MQQLFILLTFGESNTYQEKHKRCCNNPFSQKIKCDQMTSLRQFPCLFLRLLGPFPWFVGSAGCLGRLGRLGGLLCLRPWRCRWRLLGADLGSCSCREAQLGIGELLKGCNPWSKDGKGLLFVSKISQSLDVFFESFKVNLYRIIRCWVPNGVVLLQFLKTALWFGWFWNLPPPHQVGGGKAEGCEKLS